MSAKTRIPAATKPSRPRERRPFGSPNLRLLDLDRYPTSGSEQTRRRENNQDGASGFPEHRGLSSDAALPFQRQLVPLSPCPCKLGSRFDLTSQNMAKSRISTLHTQVQLASCGGSKVLYVAAAASVSREAQRNPAERYRRPLNASMIAAAPARTPHAASTGKRATQSERSLAPGVVLALGECLVDRGAKRRGKARSDQPRRGQMPVLVRVHRPAQPGDRVHPSLANERLVRRAHPPLSLGSAYAVLLEGFRYAIDVGPAMRVGRRAEGIVERPEDSAVRPFRLRRRD